MSASPARRPGPSKRTASRPTASKSGRRLRHLQAVKPARSRRLPFLIASFVIVGAMIFCVVSLQALVSQTSFRMQNLDRQSSQLRQSYGELKLEVAQLSAPGRISREAKRLGLRLPDSGHVKTLDVPGMTAAQARPSPGAPSFALKGILGEEP